MDRRELDIVVGFGRSGRAVAGQLLADGREVLVVDADPDAVDAAARAAWEGRGIRFELGAIRAETLLAAARLVVSPGVPLASAPIARARAAGVEVLAEVEFAARRLRGRVVGITGSNGKTTTTALIGGLLVAGGIDAVVCGNIGSPLTGFIPDDTAERVYVCELSSFQLEGIDRLHPVVAVVTNLSPDHMDRYADFASYVAAKRRIFRNQDARDRAILNADDAEVMRMGTGVDAEPWSFSSEGEVARGACVVAGEVVLTQGGARRPVLPVGAIPLVGRHNLRNVLAAVCAADHFAVSTDAMAAAVRSFAAPPHRLERVADVGGVTCFDDSKATNVESVLRALESFPDRRVVVLLGGRDKGTDFAPLAPALARAARAAIAYGEARAAIEAAIRDAVPTVVVGDLDAAVAAGLDRARPGDVLLLSPACASFDQYTDYQQRGAHFRELVQARASGEGA